MKNGLLNKRAYQIQRVAADIEPLIDELISEIVDLEIELEKKDEVILE